MFLKKTKGLFVNIDEAEGKFEMPEKLAIEHPLNKIDILSDWINDIDYEYRKALGEYFVWLNEKFNTHHLQFEVRFKGFKKIANAAFTAYIPDDLESICRSADQVRILREMAEDKGKPN